MTGVEIGQYYRFRYRVRNVIGWSTFSDTSYMAPYAIPDSPPEPTYVSGTSTTVTLLLSPSDNDNGLRISSYELWIDAGNDFTSSFS